MKKIMLTVLFIYCAGLKAEDKKKSADNKKNNEFQTMDLKQFEGIQNTREKPQVQFEISCKTDSGQQLKATDVGYDECLAQAKKNKIHSNNTEKK